jgi:hypothetical protein
VLFSGEQWELITEKYKYNGRDKSKILRKLNSGLAEIRKEIKGHNLGAAYKTARKLEIDTGDDAVARFYAIYAHVTRVYKERSYILGTAVIDTCSENDSIVKLWGEVFEVLFAGNKDVYLRWGETTSDLTTNQKKLNRPGEKHVVGLKVDCRAVVYFGNDSTEVDVMNMEAAKSYEENKISHDRIKLIAEAKAAFDHFHNSCHLSPEKKAKLVLPIVQITGSKCEVCCYRLAANGLYVLSSIGSLTISPVPTEFADHCYEWYKLLKHLKTLVFNLYDTSVALEQKKHG